MAVFAPTYVIMLRRRSNRSVLVGKDSVSGGKRGRLYVWLLEAVILGLIGVNVYLSYSFLVANTAPVAVIDTPVPLPSPSFARVQVEVLNGCGDAGAGQAALKYLRKKGFDVINMENAESFDFPETIVLDRSGQASVSEAAQAVAQTLGTPNVILQRNDDRMVDVTAIIGRDFDQLQFYGE